MSFIILDIRRGTLKNIKYVYIFTRVRRLKVKSWLDYQAEFAELIPHTNGATLELQFGEGAEDWSVRGINERIEKEFMALSSQAGQALLEVHLRNHETGSNVAPEIRWFRLLRERNSPENVIPLLIDKQGVALSEWSLDSIAEHAAFITADLHKTHEIQSSQFWLMRHFYKDPMGTTVKAVGILVLVVILMILGAR